MWFLGFSEGGLDGGDWGCLWSRIPEPLSCHFLAEEEEVLGFPLSAELDSELRFLPVGSCSGPPLCRWACGVASASEEEQRDWTLALAPFLLS